MRGIGNFFRYSFAALLVLITFLVLLIGIPTVTVTSNLSDRTTMQRWIKESKATQGIVDKALQAGLSKSNEAPELKKLLEEINNPHTELGQLKSTVLTQEKIDNAVTTLINAGYDWLEGKTNKPTFEIQLVSSDTEMTKIITTGFKIKFESLPECETVLTSLDNFNPLEAECRPKGLSSTIVETYISAHQDSPEYRKLFDKTKLTSDAIAIDQEVTDRAQRAYRVTSHAGLIWIVSLLLITSLITLLLFNIKRALFINGVTFIAASLLWIVARLILSGQRMHITQSVLNASDKANIPELRSVAENLMTVVFKDLASQLLTISVIILVTGILMVAVGVILKIFMTQKPSTLE